MYAQPYKQGSTYSEKIQIKKDKSSKSSKRALTMEQVKEQRNVKDRRELQPTDINNNGENKNVIYFRQTKFTAKEP